MTDNLQQGRAAYQRRAWEAAYDHLSAADQHDPLSAADLDLLGMAAYLTGHMAPAVAAWERAHKAFAEQGEISRGVRCAFWLGMSLVQRGEQARGGGWLARADRLLHEAGLETVERGYLLVPAALQALHSGDPAQAHRILEQVTEIADRFGDPDLSALGRLGLGQALIAAGKVAPGVAHLDEAMLCVTTGEVSPIAAGIIYCAVIVFCRMSFDLRRAREWTAALSTWCATQPGLKPYRGQCLVHRSEIMQLAGEWSDAMDEILRACEHLDDPPGDPVMGMALYQQAELLRLRGDLAQAETAYRQAAGWGHPAQPGLALLRMAQGRIEDATAAIGRTLAEADGPVDRSRVLPTYVEIKLASGDTKPARDGADELSEIAASFDSPYLRAVAAYAHGCVLLDEDDATAACTALRRAWTAWTELDAPYEAARVRQQLARAYLRLGDNDSAAMELDAAGRVFEQMGAAPALAQVRSLSKPDSEAITGGLTPRELELLRLLATGATNRAIADTLVISEKTVARHVSNIFTKLGVNSRSAATAFAYEHRLV